MRSAVAALCCCGFAAADLPAAEPGATLKWKHRSSVAPRPTASAAVTATVAEPRRLDSTYSGDVRLVAHETQPAQAVAPLDDPFGDKAKPAAPMPIPSVVPQPAAPDLLPKADLPPSGGSTLPGIPPSAQSAQSGGSYQNEPCPKPSGLKPIAQLTNVIAASQGDLPQECTIDDRVEPAVNRPWECVNFTWKASGLCHKPLYFEEQALERYGHSTGPITQPLVSAAHFFGTLPVLPYKMGVRAPWECEYALGYYRPGSCAPYVVPGVPITARAIASETAAVLGLVYILP